MKYIAVIAVILLAGACGIASAEPAQPAITGVVSDPTGAVVPHAEIVLMRGTVEADVTTADAQGHYAFANVAPGEYQLQVNAPGFAPYRSITLQVAPGRGVTHNAKLTIAAMQQQVNVADSDARPIDVEPSNNAGATVISGKALDSLSDDPDALAEDLQALAGPSAGPDGGEVFVDGFSGGKLPPKSSIREIRVNQNPFSSEFDRLGYGRIEILTKPGTDKFRGDAMFNFGDSIFNSRNPFADEKPHSQRRMMDATLSGPINKRSSFFTQFTRRDMQETSIINALVLDDSLNQVPFKQSVLTPNVHTEISGRVDYQLSTNHTLVTRYEWENASHKNSGIGMFSLPSRATSSDSNEHQIQITETAVLSPKAIQEVRFQFHRDASDTRGLNSDPAINVADAFNAGGTYAGVARDAANRWELTDIVSISRDRHMIKFGGRVRRVGVSDQSLSGYNGSFSFANIESYQITEQGLRDGLSMAEIRALGGGPIQFRLTTGDPTASVSQVDGSIFVQDDWRIVPQFTLSTGLRYEIQNNISDRKSIAPRLGFAWAPGGQKKPIAVVRGGFGIFYQRVSQGLTMDVNRQNGIRQQQYLVNYQDTSATNLPDFYPNIPSVELLQGLQQQQVIRVLNADIRAPYIMQTALSVERQLPKNITLSLTYTNSRGVHSLRSRNINAPLPGTYDPAVEGSGVRPFPGGNIYSYESTGVFRQNQLIANVNARVNRRMNFFGFYTYGKAKSNTDGAGSFPMDQYDPSMDYARAGFDVRHRMFLGGSLTGPYGVTLSPFIVVSSGAPFNIIVGRDVNGDGIINDRPAWATDLNKTCVGSTPCVMTTKYGAFDLEPGPGQTIIPRNLGEGPGNFTVNMRMSKTFGFGKKEGAETASSGGPGGMGGRIPGLGGPGGHGHGRGPGGFGGRSTGAENSRYALTFSASARNVFNRVNLAAPISNLSAGDRFGTSVALGGFGYFGSASANRVVEFQTRFSF